MPLSVFRLQTPGVTSLAAGDKIFAGRQVFMKRTAMAFGINRHEDDFMVSRKLAEPDATAFYSFHPLQTRQRDRE